MTREQNRRLHAVVSSPIVATHEQSVDACQRDWAQKEKHELAVVNFFAAGPHMSWGKESRMKANRFTHTLVIAALATLATGAFAAEPAKTLGQREYEGHCAVCHGVTGKGDGPYAGIIETKMPDLTVLSRNNKGVFPVDRVFSTIEGGAPPKAHGTQVMPIWGQRYRIEAAEQYREVRYDERVYVGVRINALIDHMLKLQTK